MKKPVILIIALVYILAIVVVGFLGIPARVYNPTTFVTDIALVFDDKLEKIPEKETDKVPNRFKVFSDGAITFNITAKPIPNEATNKKIIFEKLDDYSSDVYTYTTETNENNGYTIATFTCNPLDSGEIKCISLKVRPSDGNKLLYKLIDIYIGNK